MSNKIAFTVTLELSDNVTNVAEIMEMAQNIANAIKSHADSTGISPQDSDSYTISASVKPIGLDEVITEKIA
jgi:hypothetical protein